VKRMSALLVVVGVMVVVGVLSASASGSRSVVASSQTFYPGAEQTFAIPAAGRIDVTLVGGTGGNSSGPDSFGGYGSVVTATTINVNPGVLYVDVGSNGGAPSPGLSGSAVSGGTGGTMFENFGKDAGGGGGASVIATCSPLSSSCLSRYFTTSEPRLAVAGGGGGGGGNDGCNGGNGGGGTPSTADGGGCANGGGGGAGIGANGRDKINSSTAGGGKGATQAHAGAGGASVDNQPGHAGVGPVGGNGYTGTQSNAQGAGGGGGYYGGGGGDCLASCGNYGAGGGAGSSWVVFGARNVTYGNDTTATPSVTITYTPKLRKV
jgi:hypothetical protein